MSKGPLPSQYASSRALPCCLPCASKAVFIGNNVKFGRSSNALLSNGGKSRIWISRKRCTVDWLSTPRPHGRIQGLSDWQHGRWTAQAPACCLHSNEPFLSQQSGSCPMWKFNKGVEMENLVLKACKILHLEIILKPILHIVRFLDFREHMPLLPRGGLVLRRLSLCNLGLGHCRMTALSRVLGRVLLSVVFFVCLVLQPFSQLASPAYAAPPADVGVTSQHSQDFYEVLFKKYQEKDEELGRVQNARNSIQEKLKELHKRMKEQKERSELVRHDLEELSKTRAGRQRKESSFSSYEERVLTILDRTFEAYNEKSHGNLKTDAFVSSYEDNLRQVFDEKFASLQAFRKETLGGADEEAALLRKARKLVDDIRVEERRLQGRALREMEKVLSQLKNEEMELRDRLGKAVTRHLTVQEQLQIPDGSEEVLKKDLQDLDSEVAEVWERMLNVKAEMRQREIGSMQVALEKLPSLEKQLEGAISTFLKDKSFSSSAAGLQQREAQEKMMNDLTKVLNNILEHKYLPEAVDIEQSEPHMDDQTKAFLDKVRLEGESSKKLLEMIDNMIKEDIKTERISADSQAGRWNIVVAPSLQRMKEEKKAELKQFLRENPEVGHQYAAQKQELILKYRDRVLAEAWYNEKHKQWEMSPESLKYAVDKELVESARIRHDRRVMYFKLKGDDRIFFADLQVFNATFSNYGGFDALHLKMLGSGVSTSVEVMWIPLSQWDPTRVFLLPFKVLLGAFTNFLKGAAANPMVILYFQSLGETIEEVLGRAFFPALEKFPKLVQVLIGLQLSDNAPTRSKAPFLMELKKVVQKRMEDRFGQGESSTAWWISLPLRCFILWIPYVYVSRLVGKVLGQFLGPGEDLNEVEWKQKKGKEIMKKLNADNPKVVEDPVRQAFDKMKRIKDPDIRLKDFAGLDMVKDEINEIITFLRNPSVFKEMGARPPRGVLIVGQPGTGKTSLAMAIAAEAKVPMVELDGLELEGGAWVGQGASNVRELFKTARELAPLIIFMDDFDYFAGVRGDSGDTRKQDHESLINQLLVELDGFETQEGVVLLATSSRPGNIDEALRRPGRMDRTIMLPMPNKGERELILRKAAEETMDCDLIELVDWKEMARKTDGMTPQQLKEVPRGLESSFVTWKYTDDEEMFAVFKWLVRFNKITPDWLANSKWMKSWKSGLRDWLGLKVTKEDVEAAVACIDVFNESRPGIEYRSPGYIWTREFKFPHAVWAAGRGLVGALLPNFDVLENIWLDQSSWEGIGFTRFTKRRDGGYEETATLTRSYYEQKLVLCFGSSVAARLLLPFGENNDLSKFEIQEAREIASSMVLEFGWGPDSNPTIYASPTEDVTLSMGDDLEFELEAKAAKLYNAAADKATEMIEKNRRVLEALLEHLLRFDAISKKDLARLMKENGAIVEDDPFVLVPYKDNVVLQATTGQSTRMLTATN